MDSCSLVFGGARAVATAARLRSAITRLRAGRGSLTLEREGGEFLQVGGSPAGYLLERRTSGALHRGWQDPPVVPFADGTRLSVGAGAVILLRSEWFSQPQVLDVASAYGRHEALPAFVHWRDVGPILAAPQPPWAGRPTTRELASTSEAFAWITEAARDAPHARVAALAASLQPRAVLAEHAASHGLRLVDAIPGSVPWYWGVDAWVDASAPDSSRTIALRARHATPWAPAMLVVEPSPTHW